MASLRRLLLRLWRRTGVAPGYHYVTVHRYGKWMGLRGTVPARLPNGMRMDCDLDDLIERTIWADGIYEPFETWSFVRALKPGDHFVDIGANVGQYALMASRLVGPEGRVHAFEPVPRNFEKLVHHVKLNKLTNVLCHRKAVWSEPRVVTLSHPEGAEGDAGTFGVTEGGVGATTAEAVRLDDYVREAAIPRVALIKIDIEGGEPFAFQGGLETLERDRPLIFSEVNPPCLASMNTSTSAFRTILGGLGYQAFRLNPEPRGPVPFDQFDSTSLANFAFHHGPPPEAILELPGYKALDRWARSGW